MRERGELSFLKSHKSSLLALSLFGLLTFLTLDNLILNMDSAIPDSKTPYRDDAGFYWSLWWFKYAVVNLHINPLSTNYMLFPNVTNLAMHSHVFTLGLLSLPFQLILEMHWIVNGWIVLSFYLSAVCMFGFLRRHLENVWLAMLGAALYTFNMGLLWRALHVHLNLMTLWWFPLALLLWDWTLERRSVGWAIVMGLCLYAALMTYSELLLWAVLVSGPYMLYTLFCQKTWHARCQVIGLGSVAVLTLLLPALVAPLPQLRQAMGNKLDWMDVSYVQSLAMPASELFIHHDADRDATLGQVLPSLALACVFLTGRRRERWLWLIVGVINASLALGPFWGEPSCPLPFMLLYDLSQGQYRTPGRLATGASLALAVFVVLSLANLFDRVRNRWVQAGIIVVILTANVINSGILAPFPIMSVPDYAVYHAIGQDQEDHTLLQVPIGVAGSARIIGPGAHLHYYGRIHHQRTLNGVVTRLPAADLDLYEQSPFLMALALGGPLPAFDEMRVEFLQRLKDWDIRYVVVHKDLLPGEVARAFIQFFNEQPELCVFHDDAETIGYRAIAAWPDCPTPDMLTLPDGKLELGTAGGDRFAGLGWYDMENVGGVQSRWAGEAVTSTLRMVLAPQDTRVRFRAMGYPANQSASIAVNGQSVGRITLSTDWAEYDVLVPRSVLKSSGPNVITLVHASLQSAFERTGGQSPDSRLLAAAYDYFVFESAR